MLGCACPGKLGPAIDDPARRAQFLHACQPPDVSRAVFQTVVRWPGRELPLTEIVKRHPEGGYSVAGVSDVGSTLYAARVTAAGQGEIISKALPFSDRWLLDGFVAELLIPWIGPDEMSELRTLPDGTEVLAQGEGKLTRAYLFDASGQWVAVQRVSGCRVRCRISLEWDEGPLPATMRVENSQKHYRAIRENVSTE